MELARYGTNTDVSRPLGLLLDRANGGGEHDGPNQRIMNSSYRGIVGPASAYETPFRQNQWRALPGNHDWLLQLLPHAPLSRPGGPNTLYTTSPRARVVSFTCVLPRTYASRLLTYF